MNTNQSIKGDKLKNDSRKKTKTKNDHDEEQKEERTKKVAMQ